MMKKPTNTASPVEVSDRGETVNPGSHRGQALHRKTRSTVIGTALSVLALGLATTAHAQSTIIDHVGDNDPANEGWSPDGVSANVFGGTETINGNTFDFWSIDDPDDDVTRYEFSPTTTQLQGSWTFSGTMRAVTNGDGRAHSLTVEDGNNRWRVEWRTDIIRSVESSGGVTFKTLDTTADYFDIEMAFDPVTSGSVDPNDELTISVNGSVERTITRSDVDTNSNENLQFGGGSTPAFGETRYNSVEFAVVPEPASLALAMGLAGLAAAVALRRRRRA